MLRSRIFQNIKNYVAPSDEEQHSETQKRVFEILNKAPEPKQKPQLTLSQKKAYKILNAKAKPKPKQKKPNKAQLKDQELLQKCLDVLNRTK